jgi:tRNA(Ile)-lysidine synthase
LASEWNPQLPAALARHADLAREDDDYWAAEIGRVAPEWLSESRYGTILRLPLPHPAIGRRLIREAIRREKGDLRQVDYRHVDDVFQICNAGGGHARVQIPGVDVMRSFDQVRFGPLGAAPQVVETPNIDRMDWNKVRALQVPVEVRGWHPGDRYRRVGHSHEQKIKELFNEFRVPLWERRTWPLLCSGDRILWAYRFGPAAEFAAGDV